MAGQVFVFVAFFRPDTFDGVLVGGFPEKCSGACGKDYGSLRHGVPVGPVRKKVK